MKAILTPVQECISLFVAAASASMQTPPGLSIQNLASLAMYEPERLKKVSNALTQLTMMCDVMPTWYLTDTVKHWYGYQANVPGGAPLMTTVSKVAEKQVELGANSPVLHRLLLLTANGSSTRRPNDKNLWIGSTSTHVQPYDQLNDEQKNQILVAYLGHLLDQFAVIKLINLSLQVTGYVFANKDCFLHVLDDRLMRLNCYPMSHQIWKTPGLLDAWSLLYGAFKGLGWISDEKQQQYRAEYAKVMSE